MKILLLVLSLVLICNVCVSEELLVSDSLKKLPPLKQGIAYNINDGEYQYVMTIPIVNYKNISLEAGYTTNFDDSMDSFIGAITYPLFKFKDFVDVPILNLIECNVGGYMGYSKWQDDDSPEFEYGPIATLINIKY